MKGKRDDLKPISGTFYSDFWPDQLNAEELKKLVAWAKRRLHAKG